MNNSFEVVFEKVPPQKIGELVSELLSHASEAECIEFSEENAAEDSRAITPDQLADRLSTGSDLTAMIRVRRFTTRAAIIDPVLIRAIKYGNLVDLEISFDVDVDEGEKPTEIMQALHVYALDIARLFSTGDVYGGMEPAMDCATRYFTNSQSGPLPLSEN
ncbi:hypothetical protein [Duganella qianjiadongensis]|uniref:Uncharacterized protein n=1 Tax=Duganella qianjiadongensis TaxID=2692176 RepID=A0ABW9VRR7_9BURK|nr:hypothetical protein [Duganella qianjiadongensis]MYM41169.1 hypothetical protein [Duganella qianjiadongensis]